MSVKVEQRKLTLDIVVETTIRLQELCRQFDSTNDYDVVLAEVNGVVKDLSENLEPNSRPYRVRFIHRESKEGIEVIRHSTAHLLAKAVQELCGKHSPTNQRIPQGVGPATEEGFFQDFDFSESIGNESVPALSDIECKMREISQRDNMYQRREVTKTEARTLFMDDTYKQQLLDKFDDEYVSIYDHGDGYIDLCRGPHIPGDRWLGEFQLLNVSAAHWMGASGAPTLSRIRGIAEPDKEHLDCRVRLQNEAIRRDHRKIAAEMELILINSESPGAVTFLTRGYSVRRQLEDLKRESLAHYGFQEVQTPTIWTDALWKQSGHWDNYQENMFLIEAREARDQNSRSGLKPMNCPGHCKIFDSKPRSYRDLPIRIAEFGVVHRNEQSGALNGMLRVRTFTQDDAHLFVAENQLEVELRRLITMYSEMYRPFGFTDVKVVVSTRPEKRLGAEELWNKAESALKNALKFKKIDFTVNEGDGAFYGPKIDYHIHDALGRAWQTGTIQVDFNLPERFGLSFTDHEGKSQTPVMIHPATFGSIERFMAILIENFEGKFPTWLAPVQTAILPVSKEAFEYAETVANSLSARGLRVEIDLLNDRIGKKIVRAKLARTPYMIVVGNKEANSKTISIRDRSDKEFRSASVSEFSRHIEKEISDRNLNASVVQKLSEV